MAERRIGIVGASGLVGHGLLVHLRELGIPAMGSFHAHPSPGLVRFDLATDDFSVFQECTHLVISGGFTNIKAVHDNREHSELVNVTRTIALARWCIERGIKPIFLSSDQVFDGTKGRYRETDPVNPINVYGGQKLAVEEYLTGTQGEFLITRLSKTYTRARGFGGMFFDIYDRLAARETSPAAFDQIFNPTDVTDVARWLVAILDLRGLVHLAVERIMSRYAFALAIADEFGFDRSLVEPIEINSLGFAESKTLDTSLDTTKLRDILAKKGIRP